MAKESPTVSKIFGEKADDNPENQEERTDEIEGQLALDAYQTAESIVIKAPIAGVKPENLEVSIVDNTVTVKGSRQQEAEVKAEDYFAQECYWGTFSRQVSLPTGVDPEKAKATLKHGVLTIIVPKEAKSKTQIVKVDTESE